MRDSSEVPSSRARVSTAAFAVIEGSITVSLLKNAALLVRTCLKLRQSTDIKGPSTWAKDGRVDLSCNLCSQVVMRKSKYLASKCLSRVSRRAHSWGCTAIFTHDASIRDTII